MNEKEIELIDGFFNKGWCCDLEEVYKAVMKLQNNWNELKKWLEELKDCGVPVREYYSRQVLDKMQELEQGKDENKYKLPFDKEVQEGLDSLNIRGNKDERNGI